MSFELSLYRLHERALYPCTATGRPRRSCLRSCAALCLALAAGGAALAAVGHAAVVGRAGCLGLALSTAGAAWNNSAPAAAWPPDTVLRVAFLANASSVRAASAVFSLGRYAPRSGPARDANASAAAAWVWSASAQTAGAPGPGGWTPAPAPAPAAAGALAAGASSVAAIVAADANFSPFYVSSSRSEGVTMGQVARTARGLPVLNLTVPLFCVELNPSLAALPTWLLAVIIDTDDVAVNAFMSALPWQTGYVGSAASGENWAWSSALAVADAWSLAPELSWSLLALPGEEGGGPPADFFTPRVELTANAAWRGIVQVVSRAAFLLLGVFAWYVSSSSAAALLRILFSHGIGTVFFVLSIIDACRRPTYLVDGCFCCCRGCRAGSPPPRPRRTPARAAAACALSTVLCCAFVCCCPCCDIIAPTDARTIHPDEGGDDSDDEDRRRAPPVGGGVAAAALGAAAPPPAAAAAGEAALPAAAAEEPPAAAAAAAAEEEVEAPPPGGTRAADLADDRLLAFAWSAAATFFPWLGLGLYQQRREGEVESVRLRLVWRSGGGAGAGGGGERARQDGGGAAAMPPAASAVAPTIFAGGAGDGDDVQRLPSGSLRPLVDAADAAEAGSGAAGARPRRQPPPRDLIAAAFAPLGARPRGFVWPRCSSERAAACVVRPGCWRLAVREQTATLCAQAQAVFFALVAYISMLTVMGSGLVEFKTHPAGMGLALWSTVLLFEYASLLFARTVPTMLILSRSAGVSFLVVFVYWCSFTYPPAGFAIATWLCFMLATILICLAECEVPALAAGHISPAVPRAMLAVEGAGRAGRALIVQAAGDAALWASGRNGWALMTGWPAAWSMYSPLTDRLRPPLGLYEQPVPPVPLGPR